MKKVAYILGALLLLLIIAIAGLSLYLTDERLRTLILPEIQEATGRDVQIDRLSYSLIRTFPRFGLIIEGLEIPDPYEGHPTRVKHILVNVHLLPLLSGDISIQRLVIDEPDIMFILYEDGTTNFDDMMGDDITEETDEPASMPDINLSNIVVNNARVTFIDHSSDLIVELSGLSVLSSLRFGNVLESTLDLDLSSLSVSVDASPLIRNLSLKLHQTSVLDIEEEILNLIDGNLVVQGLALTLDGSISDWGNGEPMIDLNLSSASDSFGALLDLVPPDYEEFIEGLDTDGGFELVVQVNGRFTEDDIPSFEATASIIDGYIQHPDVPERISNINLSAEADNHHITIRTFEARAGETVLSATGHIQDPMEEQAEFFLNAAMNADLSTIELYVPINEFDIQSLRGNVSMTAEASGPLRNPENALFDVTFDLAQGSINHSEIEYGLEGITLLLKATQDEISVPVFSARSSNNHFTASGNLSSPLNPEASVFQVQAELEWDLETLPGYYPIDTDTLDLRGRIVLEGTANGPLEDVDALDFDASFRLLDGYISYHMIERPIESLTANGRVNSSTITITNASVQAGSHRFSLSGSVRDYLLEHASFDLAIDGLLALAEIKDYYPVDDEFGLDMSGSVNADVNVTGRIDQLDAIQLQGPVNASDVNVASPDLLLPLRELNGRIDFRGKDFATDEITLFFGESDYTITGTVQDFMAIAKEPGESEPSRFSGTFTSSYFDADEFMDFDDTPEDPEPFDAFLPNLAGSIEIGIERLLFFGLEATNISGTVDMTPSSISSDNASLSMYQGEMDGAFRWDIFAPDHTGVTFNGELRNMRVEELFADFQIGNLGEHVRADFSATTRFYAEFDEYMEMDMKEVRADGNFGMDEARIVDHPVQESLSRLFSAEDLKDLSLDHWTANYQIEDGVMTLTDFDLTSRDIGLNLSGTQHLITEEMDYKANVVLPSQWANRLGGIIPGDAVEALRRDDGMLIVPVTIRGTANSPRLGVDESQISEKIQDFLKDRAREEGRDVLEGVLDRLRRN